MLGQFLIIYLKKTYFSFSLVHNFEDQFLISLNSFSMNYIVIALRFDMKGA
jgi:hypothetical protein